MPEAARLTSPPVYPHDFYSDEFLQDPYAHYRAMRDLAPVVNLPLNDGYAITRYADVRAALRNDRVFISGRGINMNQPSNDLIAGRSALNMDDPAHRERRQIIAKPLMPAALAPLRTQIRAIADDLIDALVARGSFDGVRDFAHILPLELVSRLVGLPEEGRERMLIWASGMFNTMGNLNHRYEQGVPFRQEARDYIERLQLDDLAPGSWGARALALAQTGEITDRQAREVIMSYVGPALDTTINATSGAILLFGQNPDQWDLVRADPRLMPAAIEEAMRLETPIRSFSRVAAEDTEVDGVALPKGARVLVVYASGNRDERRWENPDRFDICRKSPQDQLAFGTGVHMCVGMHLARLEMHHLFEALARRVVRFEIGTIQRTPHQILRGLDRLEVRILEVSHT
jgi:cytochrome P450